MVYQGVYTHKNKSIPIEIHNDGEYLSVEIEGLLFKGREFTDLCYQGDLEEGIIDSTWITLDSDLDHCLTDCQFEFTVSQYLLSSDGITELAELMMCFSHGSYKESNNVSFHEEVRIELTWKEKVLVGKSGFVEVTFDQLKKQLPQGYSFKNCYGCLYGDYSIYGNSSFGTMMCFKHMKQKYTEVGNKEDYSDLCVDESDLIEWVQEINYCDEFEVRGNGGAYR